MAATSAEKLRVLKSYVLYDLMHELDTSQLTEREMLICKMSVDLTLQRIYPSISVLEGKLD